MTSALKGGGLGDTAPAPASALQPAAAADGVPAGPRVVSLAGGAAAAIGRLSLFEAAPDSLRARLAELARPLRFTEGDVIFRRGDQGDSTLVVADGLVRVHVHSSDGREVTLALVGAGHPLGELSVLDGAPRSADATALTPVRAYGLSREDLLAMLRAHPELAASLLRTLTARLRAANLQIEAVGLKSLTARVAAVLLHLAQVDSAGIVRLSQGQIAAMVAATRPKVNRVLMQFREQGLVTPSRAGLKLTDRPALQALCED